MWAHQSQEALAGRSRARLAVRRSGCDTRNDRDDTRPVGGSPNDFRQLAHALGVAPCELLPDTAEATRTCSAASCPPSAWSRCRRSPCLPSPPFASSGWPGQPCGGGGVVAEGILNGRLPEGDFSGAERLEDRRWHGRTWRAGKVGVSAMSRAVGHRAGQRTGSQDDDGPRAGAAVRPRLGWIAWRSCSGRRGRGWALFAVLLLGLQGNGGTGHGV
jgi:hypothetical protein